MLDKDIREPLFDYIDERYGKVRIFEEKVILKSRADVLAIIEGEIIGFEIKSDNDTYTRLSRQVRDYDRFCDRCYAVVGESHIHIDEHIPEYWGIIVVNKDNVIVDREATTSPKIRINNQLDILWRDELYNIQMKEGLPKLSNWRRRDIYKRLVETAGEPTIKADITEQLFERDYTRFSKTSPGMKSRISSDKKPKKTSKNNIKKTSKKYSRSRAAAKKRAHVTNYIG